jgi:zinc and cadmium transporter
MIWFYSIVSVCLVSSISLIGVFTIAIKKEVFKRMLLLMVAFSAGALLGDAFIHLLPEIVETRGFDLFVTFSIMAGIIVFFILEKFLRWHHCHETGCNGHIHHLGTMSLISDGIHNYIDGLLIGASFLVSIPLGLSTTLAVILHEIPQELGNFSVLIHAGFSNKKALLYNFISALTAVLGVLTTLIIGKEAGVFPQFMIPFTVGTFFYISLSDLVPELHKENSWQKSLAQLASFILGIVLMLMLLFMKA